MLFSSKLYHREDRYRNGKTSRRGRLLNFEEVKRFSQVPKLSLDQRNEVTGERARVDRLPSEARQEGRHNNLTPLHTSSLLLANKKLRTE